MVKDIVKVNNNSAHSNSDIPYIYWEFAMNNHR